MTQVLRIFKELETRWAALMRARPSESFDGFKDLPPAAITESIRNLGSVIEALDARGLFTSSPELTSAAPLISTRLARASSAVNDALGNNLNWLAQTSFFDDLATVQASLAALTTKRIALVRDIAKDLEKKGLPEIERVIAASEAAASVLESKKKVDEVVSSLGAAATKAQETSSAIQNSASEANASTGEIKRLEAESKASAQAAIDAASRVEGTSRAIAKLKEEADAREVALEEQVKGAREQVAKLEDAAKSAQQEVRAAMRLARDQGLADSFQKRSRSLYTERMIWTVVFVAAVVALIVVAIVFVVNLQTLLYEEFLIALLKKLSIAAPCVWMGWYAARQVGRAAKVQEDYEYKAASALAYQSYKAEAAMDADPELRTKLLRHAIETFGENPVRLYADGLHDAVTPMESVIKSLPPEKIFDLALAALNATKRGG